MGRGYIYFIRAMESGRIKIGKSKDPTQRRRELQTSSPEELQIVSTYEAEDMSAEENRLHQHFNSHRIRGEWFLPDESILSLALTYADAKTIAALSLLSTPTGNITRRPEKPALTASGSSFAKSWRDVVTGTDLSMPLCRLYVLDVPVLLKGSDRIDDLEYDLWPRSEAEDWARRCAASGFRCMYGTFYETRKGTRATARMLRSVIDDTLSVTAVVFLALMHETTCRSNQVPKSWRSCWETMERYEGLAFQHVKDRPWFERWVFSAAGAIPRLEFDLSAIVPDNQERMRSLVKACVSGVLSGYQLIRLVPLKLEATG